MGIIAYHGSNSNFSKLRIHKSLVKSEASLLNEGLGIYFSLDKSVASSYGKYLYTLEIKPDRLKDLRIPNECNNYVKEIVYKVYQNTGVDITGYLDQTSLAFSLNQGHIAISGAGWEIALLLDSVEQWYYNDSTVIEKVNKILRSVDKKVMPAYLFNHAIPNIGIIKDVSDDVVKIIDKQKIR